MFPGLVNCTTIDWFTEWPADALYEVASRQMAAEPMASDAIKAAVCKVSMCYIEYVACTQWLPPVAVAGQHLGLQQLVLQHKAAMLTPVASGCVQMFVSAHQSVEEQSRRLWLCLKRHVYVTPTNYLETVSNYRALLAEKRAELSSKAGKLQGGLLKLDETRVQVRDVDPRLLGA
jgi:dynein heavy chain